MEVYASQLLHQVSDLTGDQDMMEAARVYLEQVGHETERCSEKLGAPSAFPSIQNFQKHVVSYFCALHKDIILYNMC